MLFKELTIGEWFHVRGSRFKKTDGSAAEADDGKRTATNFPGETAVEPVKDWTYLTDAQVAELLGIPEPLVVTVYRSTDPDQPTRYVVRKLRLDAWGRGLPQAEPTRDSLMI